MIGVLAGLLYVALSCAPFARELSGTEADSHILLILAGIWASMNS